MSFQFSALDTKIKAKLALEYADYIYGVIGIDKVRDAFTTALLRTSCGCVFEPYFDELLGEWKVMEGHDRGCHRARFPILQDWADSTIKRRELREKSRDNGQLLHLEESRHATA